MQANARRQFVNTLERKAAERGMAADVGSVGKGSHFSISLVSKDVVTRIPFILSTRQEISPLTYRMMLYRIANFLADDHLTEKEHLFGLAARELIQEFLETSRSVSDPKAAVPSVPTKRPAGKTLRDTQDRRPRSSMTIHKRFFERVECYSRTDLIKKGIAVPKESDLGSGMLVLMRDRHSVYPAFQFSEDKPRALVAHVLSIFAGHRTPWQAAFWFISANSWLDGAAPRDRLNDELAIVSAAIHEVTAVVA